MKNFLWMSMLKSVGRLGAALAVAAVTGLAGPARAGLSVDIHLYHDSWGYYFYPWLSANSTLPAFPDGIYQIASPQIPNTGSRLVYQASGGNISECYNNDCGGSGYYGSFDAMLYGITNGQWSITVTNTTATNRFFFTVAVSGVTSDGFGLAPQAIYPTNNAIYVPNAPLFQWSGPTNWAGTLYVQDSFRDTNGNNSFVDGQNLSPGATDWTSPTVLPNGTNLFSVNYQSNVTALIIASQPTNLSGQPISGWISAATLESQFPNSIAFVVGQLVDDFDPFLVARYDYEQTNDAGYDSSGNNNFPDCSTSNGTNYDTFSTNAAVGSYARLFFGETSYCFTQADPAYENLSNALSGNFTVTAWVNTTNEVNSDYANAYFGAPIFFAGVDYNNHCTIPLAIAGSKAAFTVVSSDGPGTITLHSTTSVNDGQYHFLAATRDQSSGIMSLYVDGNLEATGVGITNPVITKGYITIAGGYNNFTGLLDDLRIYSTNLSTVDLGAVAGSRNGLTLTRAIGATNLTVATSGDANWFFETTNTYDGAVAAAQSGSISNYQTSTLTAVVTGPGVLSFAWSSIAEDPNGGFDCEFYIDDPVTNDIADLYGDNAWESILSYGGNITGPIPISAGQHTLGWTVYANGDTDPTEAAFLDQVVFIPVDTTPVSASITVNIYRSQNPDSGDIYMVWPWVSTSLPAATGTTTNAVQSPNGAFSGQSDQGGSGSGSIIMPSLESVLNEFTNGLWSLYINKGMTSQRRFQFAVSVSGLTTNLLQPVAIIQPTNGTPHFPASAAIKWLGPTNFTTLSVSKQSIDGSSYVGTDLPVTATSWSPLTAFAAGTNRCDINYTSNNFPNISFTVPVDSADSQTVSNWATQVNLNSTATAIFVVTGAPSQTTLLNPQFSGTSFQFSFQSQSGVTNTVQYRTNLLQGSWQSYTNIAGDGALKIIPLPRSVFGPSPQGFIRISTQ